MQSFENVTNLGGTGSPEVLGNGEHVCDSAHVHVWHSKICIKETIPDAR